MAIQLGSYIRKVTQQMYYSALSQVIRLVIVCSQNWGGVTVYIGRLLKNSLALEGKPLA